MIKTCVIQPYDKGWFAASNIRDDDALANIANISRLQIKVGLQYMKSANQSTFTCILTSIHANRDAEQTYAGSATMGSSACTQSPSTILQFLAILILYKCNCI